MHLVRTFIGAVGFLAIAVSLLFASEALMLGPFASPERISEYRFGSEAMVGHGGAAYVSRTSYVAHSALVSMLLFASSICSLIFVRRGRYTVAGLSLLFASMAVALVALSQS